MAILSDTTNRRGIRVVVSDDPTGVDPELALIQARAKLDKHVKRRARKTADERRADALEVRLRAGETIDLDDPNIWNFAP